MQVQACVAELGQDGRGRNVIQVRTYAGRQQFVLRHAGGQRLVAS